MNSLFELSLVCGSLILFPGLTFGVGVWAISRYFGTQRKLSHILYALLLGLVAFEASALGMLIDPRKNFNWMELFLTATTIGVVTTIFVVVFTPIYLWLLRLFK